MPSFFIEHQNVFLIGMGLIIISLFIYVAIISYKERKKMAASKALGFVILMIICYGGLSILEFHYKEWVSLAFIIGPIIKTIVLFLPIRGLSKIKSDLPQGKTDERIIMFSRMRLEKDSDRFKSYYQDHPEHLESDNEFRKLPGLLKEGSINYDPVLFGASDASFFTVDQLHQAVDGPVNATIRKYQADELSRFVKKWVKKLGALDVGITELKDYHIYSHVGRGDDYGKEVELNHKYAIAFTVEMDEEFTELGPKAPIVMESAQQYLNAGVIAVQLGQWIRNLGYEARAHIDGNYRVVCPLVAKDAGLGEIGRIGLLMTPKLGPRVRIGVVTTTLPLITDIPTEDKSMIDFCEQCKKCAHVCPSDSISLEGRKNINGVNRWQINSDTCFNFWCKVGTDCGRCMAVCPYAHPDNTMHNLVRFGIKNNFMLRKLALWLDDYFYGKIPVVKDLPKWMQLKEIKDE